MRIVIAGGHGQIAMWLEKLFTGRPSSRLRLTAAAFLLMGGRLLCNSE